MLATLAAHEEVGVVGGAGDEGQDLSRGGLHGHDGAYLAHHELLAIGLQVGVEAEVEVLAGHRLLVELAFAETAHDAVVYVNHHHLQAFLAAQLLLVRLLDARLADVVALLVVALLFVFFQLGRADLADVAQGVGGDGVGVVAHRTRLEVEARIAVKHLGDVGVVLF